MALPAMAFALAALLLGALLIRWPELGALLAVLSFYLNLPSLAVTYHGLPFLVAGASSLLVIPALLQNYSQRRIVIDPPFLWMIVFLGCAVLSSFAAPLKPMVLQWMARYCGEGLLVYLLIVNLVRGFSALRKIVWVIVIAGALLGSLTVYQELTKSYSNEFGGLAQRSLELETEGRVEGPGGQSKVRFEDRARGPVDAPNRYSQILVVLLPLGWWCSKHSRDRRYKVIASILLLLIAGGITFTYSRGGFVGTATVVLLMVVLGFLRPHQLLAGVVAGALIASVAAPGYMQRILTIRGLEGLFSAGAKEEPDSSGRARVTAMLAALDAFRDHPILGVGPGQFTPVYSLDYMSEHYSLRRMTHRLRGHNMYLELAAETGLVGTAAFMAILFVLIRGLLRVRRRWASEDAEVSDLATAFLVATGAYLSTAMFLHLDYQRYYWFLLALASSMVEVARGRVVLGRASIGAPIHS